MKMTENTNIKKAEKLLEKARSFLTKKAPYISQTLYGLVPQFIEGCGTMAVTKGLVMYADPDWMANEPAFKTDDKFGEDKGYEVFASCVYHECMHVLRDLERIDALENKELANIAADIPINDNLREAGWVFPPWVLYHESHDLPAGLTLEQYYKLLRDKAKQQQQSKSGKDSKDSQEQSPSGGGKKKSKGDKPSSGKPSTPPQGPCAGQCGSIAGHAKDEQLEDKLDAQFGKGKAEKEVIIRSTLQDIKDHIQAYGRGSAPGFDIEKLETKKEKSTVDWKKQVRKTIRRVSGRVISGGNDYSLRRPSKRSMLLRVLRPGLIDQQCEVLFIRDTSGSMGKKQLVAANNQVIGCIKQLGLDEVWFMDADTEVKNKPLRVRMKDIPRLNIHGRGGTSFIEPLQRASKLSPRPDIVIYLTDGDGSAPEKAPAGMAVIWCLVPSPCLTKPANFGTIVICSNKPEDYVGFEL